MTTTTTMAELPGLIGTELGSSEWHEVTQEHVNLFAEATGDHQWIHVDVERAKAESPFGGPIAHGYLTLSLLAPLSAQVLLVTDTVMGVNYGLNKVRFPVAGAGRVEGPADRDASRPSRRSPAACSSRWRRSSSARAARSRSASPSRSTATTAAEPRRAHRRLHRVPRRPAVPPCRRRGLRDVTGEGRRRDRLRRRARRADGRGRRRRPGRRRRGHRRHAAAPGGRRGRASRAPAARGRADDARAQGPDGRPRPTRSSRCPAPRARSRSCSRPGPGACSGCTPSRRRCSTSTGSGSRCSASCGAWSTTGTSTASGSTRWAWSTPPTGLLAFLDGYEHPARKWTTAPPA